MRILHMVPALDGGGVERILYDYCCAIDQNKIQFDFIKVKSSEGILEKKFRDMGCKIYDISPLKDGYDVYSNQLRKILQEKKYQVIHCHGGFHAVVALKIAKEMKIPIRIVHAHTAHLPETWKQVIVRKIATGFTKYYATHLCACGEEAAKWMWGKNSLNFGKVTLIRNAINTEKFKFSSEIRDLLRKELGIDGKFVIGHVGRFSYQKNHEFLLNIFAGVLKKIPTAELLLIGRGELEEEISKQIKQLNIKDNVKILGVRTDIADLLNAMDLFVLPSHYEGLPVTMIEVQANGLPAFISEKVTSEIQINDNVKQLPLEVNCWVNHIVNFMKEREKNGIKNICDKGYDINIEANRLKEFYLSLK